MQAQQNPLMQLADEAVCIGEGPSSESYLNIPNLLAAAVSRGVDALHPVWPVLKHVTPHALTRSIPDCSDSCAVQGYGFLSENAAFVDICGDHGIEFIGPTSKHISMMGDKSTARDTMAVGSSHHCQN